MRAPDTLTRRCSNLSLAVLIAFAALAAATTAASAHQTTRAALTALTASAPDVTVGNPVTFTAAATSGSGSYEYKFDLYDLGQGTWTALQGYASGNAVTWTPAPAGTFWVQVWVRNAGSASPWDDWRNSTVVTVTPGTPAPAQLASYTTSLSTPTISAPVTFTAAATGGSGSYEYKFDLYDVGQGTWTALQGYASGNAVTWTPATAGTFWVQVWVRNAGSVSPWDDWRNSTVVTVEAPEHWSVVRTVAGSLVVTWGAVPDATAYLVLESPDRAALTGSPALDGAATVATTSYTSSTPADATVRYFRVFPVIDGVAGDGGPVAASTSVTPHAVATPFPPFSGPSGEAFTFDVTPALWDIDGDGCLDMVGRFGHCDGTFTPITLDPAGIGLLMADDRANRDSRFADLTGDGLVDIFTNVYAPADDTSSRAVLLVGQPDGTFRPDAGISALGIGGFGETVVVADFDNDGDIDIYLPHYFDRNDGAHSWLLVNDGHGVFHDAAADAGLDSTAPLNPEGAQALDVNQDGWVDLLVAGHLYINNHDLTFTDQAATVGLPVVFDEGLLLLDVDLDGELDLVHHDGQVTRLYRSIDGHLDAGITLLGADGQTHGYGLNACDVNGDGYQDIIVAQNSLTSTSGAPRLLLNGGGHFAVSEIDSLTASYVDLIACADLDGSGLPDLLVRSRVGASSVYQSLVNNGGATETLTLRVLGAHGERNQQGRAVRVRPATGSRQTLLRFVESGSAYMAQNGYDLLVGVPWATTLEVSVLFEAGWVTTTAQPGDALTIHEDGRVVAGLH
ncbi:FG-GAP-like repeat-containing protein [Luteitalea sp.]